MKPRVLISGRKPWSGGAAYRLVRRNHGTFVIEKVDGYDALNRVRWRSLLGDNLKEEASAIIDVFGASLVRRENEARKARRERRKP